LSPDVQRGYRSFRRRQSSSVGALAMRSIRLMEVSMSDPLGASGILLGGRQVGQPPQADGSVITAGEGIPAIAGEDRAPNPALVAIEAAKFFAGRHLPKADAVVLAAGKGVPPVRRKGYATNFTLVPLEPAQFLFGCDVP
jgi:hypothetical protein